MLLDLVDPSRFDILWDRRAVVLVTVSILVASVEHRTCFVKSKSSLMSQHVIFFQGIFGY